MRILLIAPAFYDYHHQIVRSLEADGHQVRFFAERPGRAIYSPAKKLPARWRRRVFDRYLAGIARATAGDTFDRVLVIRGEIVTPDFVRTLRRQQSQARFVLYEWDSYRVTDFRPLVPLFDAVASFDSVDAEELGIGYLPLFHIPAYRLKDAPAHPQWDLVFVGSYHAARYQAMQAVRDQCAERGLRLRHYLYIAPVDYLKLRLTSANPPARADVAFRKLDQASVVGMYRDAAAILDIENNKQAGMTMRSFEALATGRYLVTTNPLATKLVPELADRIITIDRNVLDLPADRLRQPPGWGEELSRYSLDAWLDQLLAM